MNDAQVVLTNHGLVVWNEPNDQKRPRRQMEVTLVLALSALAAVAHAADDESGVSSSSTTILIIVIVAVVVVLALLLWWCCSRQRMRHKSLEDGDEPEGYSPKVYSPQRSSYISAEDSLTSGIGGFLASRDTYGSSSVWTDPVLTSSRIATKHISRHKLIAQSSDAQVWIGSLEDREVVVKQLWGESRNMQAALRLATQVKAFVGLRHPRIVDVIGVAWQNALDIHVIMEYLPKGDLRALLASADGTALTWAETKCAIAIDVADGLEYLHQLRPMIMMRDVSASRVVLDSMLRAKLSLVHASTAQTNPFVPELIMGERETDRSDVFAFGLLLSELDTCTPPFKGMKRTDGEAMDQLEVLLGITNGEVLPAFTDECPEPIRALAVECLVLAPEKRPSASQLAYRLRAILKEEL